MPPINTPRSGPIIGHQSQIVFVVIGIVFSSNNRKAGIVISLDIDITNTFPHYVHLKKAISLAVSYGLTIRYNLYPRSARYLLAT